MDRKIAVIFPGIGYHKDKPLLYYGARLARDRGYEVIDIEYHDMPQKIRGNVEMMRKAAGIACEQSADRLSQIDLADYKDVLFIGKSIGTVALADYVKKHDLDVKQIWYTPVEATFSFGGKNVLTFIGDADPWSDVDKVKAMAREQGIPLYSYPDCNHSLECDSVDQNLVNIRDVMSKTAEFIDK